MSQKLNMFIFFFFKAIVYVFHEAVWFSVTFIYSIFQMLNKTQTF